MLILEVELHVVKYYKISRFRRKKRLDFGSKLSASIFDSNVLSILRSRPKVTKYDQKPGRALPRERFEKARNELFSLKNLPN